MAKRKGVCVCSCLELRAMTEWGFAVALFVSEIEWVSCCVLLLDPF